MLSDERPMEREQVGDGVAKRFRREASSSNLFASGSEKSLLWVNLRARALPARLAVGLADDGRVRPWRRRWQFQSQAQPA